jgi:hypothetical protein
MLGKDIKNHFYLEKGKYDCFITISIEGKDKELMKELMGKIYFDVNPQVFKFEGYTPDENSRSIERVIFVKKEELI